MRREDRTSISSHPLADLGWKLLIGLRHRSLLISRSSFVRAKSRSFVPARRASIASRAGAVKAGRRAWLAAGSGVARLRLDRTEHGARIKPVGPVFDKSARDDGTFSRGDFAYNQEADIYVCPAGMALTSTGTLVND